MTTQTWLTQEAADRLAAELTHLEGEARTEIIKKIVINPQKICLTC